MPYLIRGSLLALAFGLLWSTLWFQPDGVAVLIPGVGGYFWEY